MYWVSAPRPSGVAFQMAEVAITRNLFTEILHLDQITKL